MRKQSGIIVNIIAKTCLLNLNAGIPGCRHHSAADAPVSHSQRTWRELVCSSRTSWSSIWSCRCLMCGTRVKPDLQLAVRAMFITPTLELLVIRVQLVPALRLLGCKLVSDDLHLGRTAQIISFVVLLGYLLLRICPKLIAA